MAGFDDYEPYYRNDKVRFSLTARLLNDFNLSQSLVRFKIDCQKDREILQNLIPK